MKWEGLVVQALIRIADSISYCASIEGLFTKYDTKGSVVLPCVRKKLACDEYVTWVELIKTGD